MRTIRPYLSRILAAAILFVAAWLADAFLPLPNFVAAAFAAALFGAPMLAAYGVLHKWIDQRVNPDDVADPVRSRNGFGR